MGKKFFYTLLVICILGTLSLAGCGEKETTTTTTETTTPATTTETETTTTTETTTPAPESKTLVIGDIENLTGPSSDHLKPLADGVKLAQKYINENGGINVNGENYMIDIILQDNEMSAESAAASANSLIFDHKVDFIVGSMPTHIIKSINSVTEPNKVIYACDYNTGTSEEYGAHTQYQFITFDSSIELVKTAFIYLTDKYPEVKTIASINVDDGQIKELDPVINQLAEENGLTIANGGAIGWTLDTVDFTPTVQKALALGADAIMTGNGSTECSAQVLRIARESGYTKPVFAWNYAPGIDVLEIAGEDTATKWFSHGISENAEMPDFTRELADMAVEEYGRFDMMHLIGFNSLYSLVQAIEAAQSLDTTAVKEAWEAMDTIDTVLGPGKMGGQETYGINHSVFHPVPFQELNDGILSDTGYMDVYSP